MTCAHCAFSCVANGSDMSKDVFKTALKLAHRYGEYITLGGGEPTIHPQFWDFLGLALAEYQYDESGIYIVTNGKVTTTALALATMAKRGVLGVSLSQDKYHDSIDPEVTNAFTRETRPGQYSDEFDSRTINHSYLVINAGRAKDNDLGDREACFCDDIVVEPDGKLWACGCRQLAFGTVFNPEIPNDYYDWDTKCSVRGEACA